jgi:hypothetical protein
MHILCILVARVALKNGIITYKTTNGISSHQKHLEFVHYKLWGEWIVREKQGPKYEQCISKKRSGPTPSTIFYLFFHVTPYSKDDPIQRGFNIVHYQKVSAIIFVEVPFFQEVYFEAKPSP